MIPWQRIFVAGHRGMAGSAVARALRAKAPAAILLTRTRAELDLRDAAATAAYLARERPDAVVLCAAKVGGIHANRTFPADFLYDNLAIAQSVIHGAWQAGVTRLLFLGSSCIYPRDAAQPLREDALLTGPLEATNEAYALAKIAGLKLCQAYRAQAGVCYHSAMPTNLYGPGDNYHPEHSHVIPGLIHRFHDAKVRGLHEVTLWGSGQPLREFLHVDDLAEALVRLLEIENPPDWVNIGYGEDLSTRALADLVAETVGYRGRIVNDPTMPDGTPRKLMDSSRMRALGWQPRIGLREGLAAAYADFLQGHRGN